MSCVHIFGRTPSAPSVVRPTGGPTGVVPGKVASKKYPAWVGTAQALVGSTLGNENIACPISDLCIKPVSAVIARITTTSGRAGGTTIATYFASVPALPVSSSPLGCAKVVALHSPVHVVVHSTTLPATFAISGTTSTSTGVIVGTTH